DGVSYTAADGDVFVHGTGSFTRADGTTGATADATFATAASRIEARTAEITSLAVGAAALLASDIAAPPAALAAAGSFEAAPAETALPAIVADSAPLPVGEATPLALGQLLGVETTEPHDAPSSSSSLSDAGDAPHFGMT